MNIQFLFLYCGIQIMLSPADGVTLVCVQAGVQVLSPGDVRQQGV